MNTDKHLEVLKEIRNWIRASSHQSVKELLQTALPESKDRIAYQMSDGKHSIDDIRKQSKVSPNAVLALQSRCVSLGLMEIVEGNKKCRLFDLCDFGLVSPLDNTIKKAPKK